MSYFFYASLAVVLLLVKCIAETASCANGRERYEDERGFIWSHVDEAGEAP